METETRIKELHHDLTHFKRSPSGLKSKHCSSDHDHDNIVQVENYTCMHVMTLVLQ